MADKGVELGYCAAISHTEVATILKKTNLNPTSKRRGASRPITSAFLAQMEQLLWLYAQPHDPERPVVCFDERPCFLMGEELAPRPLQTGQVPKEHYAYQKNGACTLLAAIEPLTGQRLAQVKARRTKKEYPEFMQALAAAYPEARKIRLVQDNLNTSTMLDFFDNPLPGRQFRSRLRV